jgi:hypothetical protein
VDLAEMIERRTLARRHESGECVRGRDRLVRFQARQDGGAPRNRSAGGRRQSETPAASSIPRPRVARSRTRRFRPSGGATATGERIGTRERWMRRARARARDGGFGGRSGGSRSSRHHPPDGRENPARRRPFEVDLTAS